MHQWMNAEAVAPRVVATGVDVVVMIWHKLLVIAYLFSVSSSASVIRFWWKIGT